MICVVSFCPTKAGRFSEGRSEGGSSGHTGAAVRAAAQQQQQQTARVASSSSGSGQRTGLQLTLNSLDMRSYPGMMLAS